MSTDFEKVLIKDDRLANLSDKITYAVHKGGQQVTSATYNAIAEGPSSCIYNIQVPSLETVIDRRVMWTATVRLKITGTSSGTTQLINYGLRDCLGPFPLHSMCQNMSATINNNTVSCNMKDILAPMLRMLNNDELARYNNSTPVAYDQYLDYRDMPSGANNNAFAGFNSISDPNIHPRGSFAIDTIKNFADGAPMPVNGTDVYVDFTVTEPLLLSPFIFANPTSNNGGLYGVQNMSFNFNMGYPNRVWRHVVSGTQTITNVEIQTITNSSLRFFFLSCHPSDQLSSRCVVPFCEFPRYLNTAVTIPAVTGNGTGGDKYTPGKGTMTSATISLNQIPDKFIIFARKKDQNWNDSDSWLAINKLNINFNNNTGICSSFSREQLWQCSVQAGSNQSYDEFRGYAFRPSAVAETTAGSGAGQYVRTSGSVVMLNLGEHVNLIEDFYSPGSIGQFNLQFSVDVENYSANTQFELVLITMNSGAFACERGTSSTYTALLTKSDVLEASQMVPISKSDHRRMVGGGFLDSLKSAFNWIANPKNRADIGKVIRTGLDIHDTYKGRTDGHDKSRKILGHLGGARSGGGLMDRLK